MSNLKERIQKVIENAKKYLKEQQFDSQIVIGMIIGELQGVLLSIDEKESEKTTEKDTQPNTEENSEIPEDKPKRKYKRKPKEMKDEEEEEKPKENKDEKKEDVKEQKIKVKPKPVEKQPKKEEKKEEKKDIPLMGIPPINIKSTEKVEDRKQYYRDIQDKVKKNPSQHRLNQLASKRKASTSSVIVCDKIGESDGFHVGNEMLGRCADDRICSLMEDAEKQKKKKELEKEEKPFLKKSLIPNNLNTNIITKHSLPNDSNNGMLLEGCINVTQVQIAVTGKTIDEQVDDEFSKFDDILGVNKKKK